MNPVLFSISASFCSAFSNFCFRKNSDKVDVVSANGFLFFLYLVSFISSFIIFPHIWSSSFSIPMVFIGGLVGALNVGLMLLIAKALQKGPAGLTFAFQNASAVFPGLLLFLLFGTEYGYSCSLLQFLGITLVLLGLYWGSRENAAEKRQLSFSWLKTAVLCLVIQIVALTLIQSRVLLFKADPSDFLFTFGVTEKDDVWFMPGQFGVALLIQSYLLFKEKKVLNRSEVMYGTWAGAANCGSTLLLLLATKTALPLQQSILFPCFAVVTMVLCNIWANRIYQEKFNFQANVLCGLGIMIAL